MPGIAKRLARSPQLYSGIGFAQEYRPLSPDELAAFLAHNAAVATIILITGGKFRLVGKLLTEINASKRSTTLTHSRLSSSMPRGETLIIGH